MIALLAAVIAAVVLLTTDAGQNTDLIKDTSATRSSRSINDFLDSNTQ